MKWLEMTMFVVFLWYPFNVKVGNVKEFAVECRTVEVDGEFRLLQKFGEALIWGLDPSGARCVPSWMGWEDQKRLEARGKNKIWWENWELRKLESPKLLVFYPLGLQVVMLVGFPPQYPGWTARLWSFRAVSQAPIHDFFESAFWEALMRHQLYYDTIWQVY